VTSPISCLAMPRVMANSPSKTTASGTTNLGAAYAQDNWRVNRRLTVNLGLRWDGVPHTYEAHDRMGNFYPSLYNPANAAVLVTNPNDPAFGTISPTSPGLGTSPNPILAGVPLYLNGIGIPEKNGVPKGLVNNHWAAFGPRIGLAYDLTGSGKTVVRGGFGIMYERIQGNDMYDAGPNIPFSLNVGLQSVSLSNPGISLATGNLANRPINTADITGLAVNNYKLPASYQYSIGVQRQLNSKSVLTNQLCWKPEPPSERSQRIQSPGSGGAAESDPGFQIQFGARPAIPGFPLDSPDGDRSQHPLQWSADRREFTSRA